MDEVNARFRRERTGARRAFLFMVLFTAVAAPLVLWDGTRSGRPVDLAVGVGCALFWVVIAVRFLRLARRWMELPATRQGLRAGLESARATVDLRPLLRWLLVLFSLWLPRKLAADWPAYVAEPWRALVGAGGFLALWGILWFVFRGASHRMEREMAALG